jgi:deoxyribodipyrimidine photo-lyase
LERIARDHADVGAQAGVHPGVAEPALLSEPPPDTAACVDLRAQGGAAREALFRRLGTQRAVELVHPWQMSEREESAGLRLGAIHLPSHAALPWSERRWRWVLQRLQAVTDGIVVGDLTQFNLPAACTAHTCAAPMPGYDAALRSIATLKPAPRLMPNPEQTCRSFTAFYQAVRRSAPSLQHLMQRSLFED